MIENRLGPDAGFSVEHRGGGMGGGAPAGESRHLEPLPPGPVRIGCHEPLSGGEFGEPDYETLRVVDEDADYVPTELECPGGEAVTGSGDQAGEPNGEEANPVELARTRLSNRLEPGDEVELAGYPESRKERVVRVVRDGRVAATVHYIDAGESWMEDRVSSCAGFVSSGG